MGRSVSSVTSQNFGGYLFVRGTQLNKQQFTTAKVSVGQSWKTIWGDTPPGASWSGELTLGRND